MEGFSHKLPNYGNFFRYLKPLEVKSTLLERKNTQFERHTALIECDSNGTTLLLSINLLPWNVKSFPDQQFTLEQASTAVKFGKISL